MHDNAQLTVIGIHLVRVEMRYLRDGQQSQEDETQHSHHRQKAVPGAVLAEIGCESRQSLALVVLILQNNALIWTE